MKKLLSAAICVLAQRISNKLLTLEFLRKMYLGFGISLVAVFLSGVQLEFCLSLFNSVMMLLKSFSEVGIQWILISFQKKLSRY